MSGVLNVDTIADNAGTGPVTLTKQEAAKSRWFYDQISVVIDDSFNVSSIEDTSAGRHKPTLTNALANTNGTLVGTTARTSIAKYSGVSGNVMISASKFDCNCESESNSGSDTESGGVVFGDLA